RLDDFPVAGKTGTAQKVNPHGHGYSAKRIGSFVGFVPADRPRVVILVLIDEPGTSSYGGVGAAPVFRALPGKVVERLGGGGPAPAGAEGEGTRRARRGADAGAGAHRRACAGRAGDAELPRPLAARGRDACTCGRVGRRGERGRLRERAVARAWRTARAAAAS